MFKFSAEDIANQGFQAKFRGYDPDQVHEFLDGLAAAWREMQKDCRRLHGEVDEQAKDLREYRRREKSLVQALETARQVAEEIRHQADRDAEVIMAETELKAERMLSQAEQQVIALRSELFDLQEQRTRLHSEMRDLLAHYTALIERNETLPPVPGTNPVDDKDVVNEEMDCQVVMNAP